MKKGSNNGMGEGKQGRHQDDDVTRIKGKGKNKGATTTKTITTKITVITRTVVMTVLRTTMQMIYILVLNPYRIKVTGHNHCLMLIS